MQSKQATGRHYTTGGGYVLGERCDRGHSGNRRYHLIGRGYHDAACQGCGNFRALASMAYASRRAALRAEQAVKQD